MPIGPCMCGDTQCPSCGAAQGTLDRDDRTCECCETVVDKDKIRKVSLTSYDGMFLDEVTLCTDCLKGGVTANKRGDSLEY